MNRYSDTERYIGDGVYAASSGHDIRLRAGDDRVIYLEPYMLQTLIDYAREKGLIE